MKSAGFGAVMITALTLLCAAAAKADDQNCAALRREPASDAAQIPGEISLVAQGGEILSVDEKGMASLELPTALTRRSVVRIASLTKQFTAAGILKLVETGKLSLDETVGERLPEAPLHWRAITIRQLLSHTSGLSGDLTPVFPHIAKDLAPNELVALFYDAPPAARPGEAWAYSNLNYWVLGLVIENVTDNSYTEYIDAQVLKPAGVSDARYGDNRDIIAGRARGYEISTTGEIMNARYFSSSIGYSAGGYVASAMDLVRWYAALGDGKIISPESLALALTPVKLHDGSETGFGLGWRLGEIGGQRVAHHGGSSIGFMAYVFWAPAQSLFAGVFHNWSDEGGEPASAARSLMTCALSRD